MRDDERRRGGRRIDLDLLIGAKILFWASLYVYVPVLPIYARQLGASHGIVGMVVGAYGLSQLLLRIPIGVASDHLGRRKPFLVGGMLANALGCVTMALAPGPALLVVGRAILGIGASTYVVSSIYLADFFPRGQIARATSLAVLVSSATQVAILLAGGFVGT
ncbi:MAG: MFS transporter, partial [Actinobacteria bacterium]|nr:MFS transporter [Actinomycetota bacterium]